MAEGPGAVTQLLIAWSDGDPQALDALVPIVYAELRRSARRYLSRDVKARATSSSRPPSSTRHTSN
jgi:hypothetical protein